MGHLESIRVPHFVANLPTNALVFLSISFGGKYVKIYKNLLITSAFVLMSGAVFAEGMEQFLGRWALTIPGGGAGWLGVEMKDGSPQAAILWGGGSVITLQKTPTLEGKTLKIERDHKIERKDASGKTVEKELTETILADVKGDILLLPQTWPHFDGKGADRREFTGKRIPPLPPRPNLAKVRYAKPITLFDGTAEAKKNLWPGQQCEL